MNKAVFWDRDGVLNYVLPQRADGFKNGSPQNFEDFKIVEEAMGVLQKIKELGFVNIVVTKQPDIARGSMSLEDLNKMHEQLKSKIPSLDAIYVCPHDEKDNCNCRKPKPGLLLDAAKDYSINLSQSFIVGDSQSDIDAGHNAGVKTIVLKTNYNTDVSNADFEVSSLGKILGIVE
jgi:histidinol-phosphate phosphatase family protein